MDRNHLFSILKEPTQTEYYLLLLLLAFCLERVAHFITVAYHDGTTGALNRSGLRAAAPIVTLRGRWAVIILDIDFFKVINDTLGHDAGDTVLRELGRMLRAAARRWPALPVLCARWGGEEFVLALPVDGRAAVHVASCIRRLVAMHDFGIGRKVTVSVGVAFARTGESMDSALRRADAAMYSAKRGGRNRVRVACSAARPQIASRVRSSDRLRLRPWPPLLRIIARAPGVIWHGSAIRLIERAMALFWTRAQLLPFVRRPLKRAIGAAKRSRSFLGKQVRHFSRGETNGSRTRRPPR
jgi:diguanylate cyclase (GGDEF)-like protein